MMDALAIEAAEAAVHPNFPRTDTVLIVELDGPAAEVSSLFETVTDICRRAGATTIEVARTDEQRARIWRGRKAAFAAMGRVSPNYYVQDGVVPRTKLPEVLARIRALEARSGLRIGNVFHAGDGNLHPLICYDERVPGEADRAVEVAAEILSYCMDAGGSLTGEHGIGADKSAYMPQMFSADDLALMQRLRSAIDPQCLCNPGKVFPTPRLCGEVPGPYREHPAEKAGLAERW
jgi:glycolate dehydrogenase FAD-linked subunit